MVSKEVLTWQEYVALRYKGNYELCIKHMYTRRDQAKKENYLALVDKINYDIPLVEQAKMLTMANSTKAPWEQVKDMVVPSKEEVYGSTGTSFGTLEEFRALYDGLRSPDASNNEDIKGVYTYIDMVDAMMCMEGDYSSAQTTIMAYGKFYDIDVDILYEFATAPLILKLSELHEKDGDDLEENILALRMIVLGLKKLIPQSSGT